MFDGNTHTSIGRYDNVQILVIITEGEMLNWPPFFQQSNWSEK